MADKQKTETEIDIVLYSVAEGVATITMDRPSFHNAQNAKMTYELDAAFRRAVADDEVKVIVLAGNGKHFSAGHDIGTPGRDVHLSQERTSMWYDHANKPGGEYLYVREAEAYLGMCRRWRDIPKPTIAAVQGACIAGGLMLAWVCDLIVATDDAFFSDPVVRMGIPGVEYFAHPFEMPRALPKNFYLLAIRCPPSALSGGHGQSPIDPRDLQDDVNALAAKIATQPRLGSGSDQAGRSTILKISRASVRAWKRPLPGTIFSCPQ